MELVAIKRIRRRSRIFFQNNAAVPLLIIGLSVHIPLRRASYYLTGCIQLVLGILLIHSILLRAKDAPCPAVDSTLMPEITDCHIICLRHSLDRIRQFFHCLACPDRILLISICIHIRILACTVRRRHQHMTGQVSGIFQFFIDAIQKILDSATDGLLFRVAVSYRTEHRCSFVVGR